MGKLNNIQLTKICIIGFLISFSIIYYIEQNYEPDLVQIKDINTKYLNHNILIKAEIISQRQSQTSDTLFAKVKDESGTIDIILFKINQTLNKNQFYFFQGKVGYYKDNYQLIITNVYS